MRRRIVVAGWGGHPSPESVGGDEQIGLFCGVSGERSDPSTPQKHPLFLISLVTSGWGSGELGINRVGWTGAQRPVHPQEHLLSSWSPPTPHPTHTET